ncbi:MAG TPA: hypothetical protein VK041_08220 [Opitutales bacterium]|nr:hypothetical protein [Opitutales bacterium]
MAKSKNKEPRLWEIIVAAILSLVVGFLGAVVFLVTLPPEVVSELPAEEDREIGKVYYVKGGEGDASHATWEAKEEALKAQRRGSMTLVEEELNQWAGVRLGEEQSPGDDQPLLHIVPGVPNFHLTDEELFVSVPLEWSLFGFGRTFDGLTSGTFEETGGRHVLNYDRVYVGSCPLPGFLANKLVRDVTASYDVAEEVEEGWAALQSVEITEEGLALVIP